jgi:hypothetical protein
MNSLVSTSFHFGVKTISTITPNKKEAERKLAVEPDSWK